jgi:hypothetical protein
VRSNRFEANDIKRSVMEATISSNIAMKWLQSSPDIKSYLIRRNTFLYCCQHIRGNIIQLCKFWHNYILIFCIFKYCMLWNKISFEIILFYTVFLYIISFDIK